MRAAVLAALALWAFAAAGWAAPVTVRTAEHDGFTRIVVDFRRRPDWRLDKTEDGYRLETGRPSLEYDLSDVYRRIGRARVARLSAPGGGALQVTLGCTCRAATFELPNQGLVIDISPGAPEPAPRSRPAFNQSMLFGPRRTIAVLPGRLTAAANPDTAQAARFRRAQDAAALVAGKLARGAAQGLVKARVASSPSPVSPNPPMPERAAPVPGKPHRFANIRVETQIDRDNPDPAEARQETVCLPADVADVAAWGTPALRETGLGALRAGLISGAGIPDPEAGQRLARALIYLGFGAEAELLLTEAQAASPIETEIARLMDGPAPAPLIAGQRGCDTPAAMWAVLARDTPPTGDDIHLEAAIATFSALPVHLRRHLGPRLVARFVAYGDRDTALAIRNAIRRGARPDDPATRMMAARVALQSPRPEKAEADLAAVSASRSPEAAEALALLISRLVRTGDPISDDLLAHAEALSYEVQDTPTARPLDIARLRGHAARGEIDSAFALLDSLAEAGPAPPEDLAAEVSRRVLKIEPDPAFLRAALAHADRPFAPASTRIAIAERIAGLGLAEAAQSVLGLSDAIPTRRERLLRAELALQRGKPVIAESYLAGLEGERVAALRARVARTATVPPPSTREVAAPDGSAPAAGPLDRNRAVLSESRSVRESLAKLLGES